MGCEDVHCARLPATYRKDQTEKSPRQFAEPEHLFEMSMGEARVVSGIPETISKMDL